MQIMLAVAFSATVFFLILAPALRLFAPRVQTGLRLQRLGGRTAGEKRKKARRKKTGAARTLFSGQDFLQKLADELYVAGIRLKPEEFVTLWWAGGLALPLLLRFLRVPAVTCLGVVILGVAGPVLYVRLKKEAVLKQFDAQLVDALTILCNSLRAGFSFQTAAENVAKELPDPIAREFRMVSRECMYGIALEDSLANLVRRTKNQDLELVVNAVVIQKKVGGNLASVLDSIAGTIKERIQLRGDIKVMTSSGRMSGLIIGALPIFLLVMLMVLNPSYIEDFISTSTGRGLLALGGCMELVGFFVVNRIVTIKF